MNESNNPPTFLIRYWPINKEPPEGWVRHPGLDGTRHAQYSTFIIPKDQEGPKK